MDPGALARRYADAFATLTPQDLDGLRTLVAPDVRFRDPFNDVRGVDRFIAVFARALEDMQDLTFATSRIAVCGDTAFLRWTMRGRPRTRWLGGELVIDGVSEVRFDSGARVVEHIDHWDAAGQLYERLPLLGGLLRVVHRRLGIGG